MPYSWEAPISEDTMNPWGLNNLPSGPNGINMSQVGYGGENVYQDAYSPLHPPILRPTVESRLIMPVEDYKRRYFFGLDLRPKPNGQEVFNDNDIVYYQDVAVSYLERELGIFIYPRVIKCRAPERGYVYGTDYDISEPEMDYDAREFYQWGYMQLRHYPLMKVDMINLV